MKPSGLASPALDPTPSRCPYRSVQVLSISQSSYFVDCIAEAEKKWRIQAARRATLAKALRTCTIDLKGWALVKAAISATVAAPGVAPAYKYVPHTATEAVLKSSTYKADHDDMVLLDSC